MGDLGLRDQSEKRPDFLSELIGELDRSWYAFDAAERTGREEASRRPGGRRQPTT